MAENKATGSIGEKEACSYLKKKGYKIIEQNYRSAFGEIDIIAKYKDKIIFVEVKKRSSNKFGYGYDAVNYSKQKKIIKTAENFINENNIKALCQFDVISIDSGVISHIENAFSL